MYWQGLWAKLLAVPRLVFPPKIGLPIFSSSRFGFLGSLRLQLSDEKQENETSSCRLSLPSPAERVGSNDYHDEVKQTYYQQVDIERLQRLPCVPQNDCSQGIYAVGQWIEPRHDLQPVWRTCSYGKKRTAKEKQRQINEALNHSEAFKTVYVTGNCQSYAYQSESDQNHDWQ